MWGYPVLYFLLALFSAKMSPRTFLWLAASAGLALRIDEVATHTSRMLFPGWCQNAFDCFATFSPSINNLPCKTVCNYILIFNK